MKDSTNSAVEWGALDPDDNTKVHAHISRERALEAAEWWNIDGKIYVRQVTPWVEVSE